jgi:hypothetical protein
MASEILLRCKLELMLDHIHYLLQTKLHLLLNLWAVRCPLWHSVQDVLESHQPWPSNSTDHLLLSHWVKPRDRVDNVILYHLPWTQIVAFVVDPYTWGVRNMNLLQWE